MEGNPTFADSDPQTGTDTPQKDHCQVSEVTLPNPVFVVSQSSGSSGEDVNQNALGYINRLTSHEGDQVSVVASGPHHVRASCEDPKSSTATKLPALATQVAAQATSSFSSKARNIFDSDSDVLSLGDCIRLPETSQPFTDTQENPVASTGEACFAILHTARKHSGQHSGLDIGNPDAE